MGNKVGRRLAAWLAIAAWVSAGPSLVAAQHSLEYEVKGQFLYRFFNFIEWPASAFPQPDAPFRLCIAGPDPFGRSLDALVQGQSVGRHPIVIERLPDERGLASCHALFISHVVDDARLASIMAATEHQSVLVVGESKRLLDLCGGIVFVLDGDRVRFDVNLVSFDRRNLKASSKLLRLAREASDRFARCE